MKLWNESVAINQTCQTHSIKMKTLLRVKPFHSFWTFRMSDSPMFVYTISLSYLGKKGVWRRIWVEGQITCVVHEFYRNERVLENRINFFWFLQFSKSLLCKNVWPKINYLSSSLAWLIIIIISTYFFYQ